MDIQTRDGIILRNIPDGTPDEAIKARIAKIRAGGATPQAAPQPAPQKQEPFVPSGEKTSGWLGGLVGYDPKALGITPAENIAGHPLTRFAMGAASPFLGAAQLGAEAMGDTTGTETLKRTEELRKRGQAAMGGGEFDLSGTAGAVVSPASLAMMKLLRAPAGAMGRIGQGAAIGAGAGAVTPVTEGEDFFGSKAAQVGTGAALGAAIPAGIEGGRAIGKGILNLGNLFTNKGAERILTNYQDELVGKEGRQAVIDALKRSMQPVPGYDPTAAEVLSQVPAGSPLVAHQRITAATRGGPSAEFGQRALDQKDALARAIEERSAVTDPMRREALSKTKQVGVSTQKLIRQMRGVVSQPGIRASDVVRKSFADTKDKIKEFTKEGFIDADDLYTIRKELGNTIRKNATETANWDKRLAAGLERDLQRNIDDAIEAAGGTGWKDYLAEFASRSRGIETAKEGAKMAYRPPQRTNLGGGMNVSEETRLHLPQMLSRPMMLANAIMSKLGRGVEPALDKAATQRYLNPQLLARELGKLNTADRDAAIAGLERMGVVGGATAAGSQF